MKKSFIAFFLFEWRRLLKWWNLVILGIFLLAALIFAQYGVSQYKNALAQKDKFLEFEKKKIEQYINYRVFGLYGFQVIAMPVPESIFFTSSLPFPEMTAVINTGPNLSIFSTLQAGSAFKTRRQKFSDLSGVFLLFGSFIFFLYGFETFMNTPLMKVMSSVAGTKKVFINTVLSRLLLITIYCSSVLVLSYLLVLVNGVSFPLHWGLPVFLVEILLCSFFFFALGAFLGTIRPLIVGFGIGIALLFLLVHVIPAVIDTIISYNANVINSFYETELKKWTIQSNYEKQDFEKHGTYKIGDTASKERMDELKTFLNNEYKQIQSLDDKMIEQMRKNFDLGQRISIFFPTSQYFAVNSELSGSGYETLLELTRYAKKIKHEFILKCLDVTVFSGSPNEKVEPFLKDNKNLLIPEDHISLYLLWGTWLMLLYISIFLGLTFKRQRKNLFDLPQKSPTAYNGKDIKLDNLEMNEYVVGDDILDRLMYCLFSGESWVVHEKGYNIKITLNGKDLTGSKTKMDFMYLCNLRHLPFYLVVGDLVSFFMRTTGATDEVEKKIIDKAGIAPLMEKRIWKLKEDEKALVLLALLSTDDHSVYLLNGVNELISGDMAVKIKLFLDKLSAERKITVIALYNHRFIISKEGGTPAYYKENSVWSSWVDEMTK